MKVFNKVSRVVGFLISLTLCLAVPIVALAASTPNLGIASTFGILSSTYTNTAAGTTINGDLGYTTGPAMAPTVTGTTHGADSTYNQAGIDQGAALNNLNSQVCTFTFAPGAIDLATDATHGPAGTYTPGVYCTSGPGAASIGAGGITLNGGGTYIFRINGALTTVANSAVRLAGGASACDVFWTPIAATTLGADSTFIGTDIDPSGIAIGNNVTWSGQALAFGGTVSTDADTITVPVCTPSGAILRVVKTVVNDEDGNATASNFTMHVRLSGADVAGSPTAGAVTPGNSYSLDTGTYVVSEDIDRSHAHYTQTFSGACDAAGSVTLIAGDDETCTITNNDYVGTTRHDDSGDNHDDSRDSHDDGNDNLTDTSAAGAVAAPGFPNAGFGPQGKASFELFCSIL